MTTLGEPETGRRVGVIYSGPAHSEPSSRDERDE
jgi:hypothetical protein